MIAVADLLRALELEPDGDHRFRVGQAAANNLGVVFGGQLLAQALVAGAAGHDGMAAKTLHTVFARGARPEEPLEITVDPMHAGRTFASSTVTISQGDRLCTRSLLLLSAEEDDFVRHADPAPAVAPSPTREPGEDWEVEVVDGVDVSDPDLVLPPDLHVWSRFPGVPGDDPVLNQACLAFATDGFLIGTAMLPHAGVGQSQAHKTVTTGVVSHTLTFHERIDAGDWLLLSHHSPHAGHGRCYGRADVFTPAGDLVAGFVQDGMLRPRDPGAGAL